MTLNPYLAIARPEHWPKNVFIIPGIVLAEYFVSRPLTEIIIPALLTLIGACLLSSANYAINEWLDAPYDKHHPTKKNRPAVVGNLKGWIVWTEYALLALAGLLVCAAVNPWVFWPGVVLLIQGLIYNVEPFRTKDRIFLDVFSESVNNPIRLLMGWGAVTNAVFPPWSILFGYWMFGAFLMDIKRFAELRFIADPERAALYRRSFKRYTEQALLLAAVFYALLSGFFFAIFMIKHRIELILALPLIAALYTWYLHIGLKPSSPAMNPERIPRTEITFSLFLICASLIMIALLAVDIPALEWFQGAPENFDLNRIIGIA